MKQQLHYLKTSLREKHLRKLEIFAKSLLPGLVSLLSERSWSFTNVKFREEKKKRDRKDFMTLGT